MFASGCYPSLTEVRTASDDLCMRLTTSDQNEDQRMVQHERSQLMLLSRMRTITKGLIVILEDLRNEAHRDGHMSGRSCCHLRCLQQE